jgi:hypothetical protein
LSTAEPYQLRPIPHHRDVPTGIAPSPEHAQHSPPADGAGKAPVGRMRRVLLAVTVVVFATVACAQAVTSTENFWSLSDVKNFYPETSGIQAARAATSGNRALVGDGTFLGSSASAHDIRTVTGHTFQTEAWRDYLLGLDPKAFADCSASRRTG